MLEVLDIGCWMLDDLDIGYWMSWILDVGCLGYWMLDPIGNSPFLRGELHFHISTLSHFHISTFSNSQIFKLSHLLYAEVSIFPQSVPRSLFMNVSRFLIEMKSALKAG